MNLNEHEILKQLGGGASLPLVCQAAGCTQEEFDRWWAASLARRLASLEGNIPAAVRAPVEIQRDGRGVPHIYAEHDQDLLLAFGFAMAQDRLFQLDYLRRKGAGRLAEILGSAGLELDILARTVGLRRIAEAEWKRLPEETRALIAAFTAGVNALIEQSADRLPIEFDLLDYRPEPWTEVDCLTIESEFRWYLTGRFPVIVMPELAKRALKDETLYRDFLSGEATDECILPPEGYLPASGQRGAEDIGRPVYSADDATGSNNWVVSGRWTRSGKPLVASDPHIALEAVSCWYQAHLCGGSFDVAGMTYVGMPAIMFGRNRRVAWGITNNICSQRDLYQERTDAAHPGCFLYENVWEPWQERTETIHVRGAEPVTRTIRYSRNGPIVDEILPKPADKTGPVSLKWLGAYQGGWLTALLGMNRAADVRQLSEALRPWHVPTFSLVFADVDGHIGFKATGRIPIRNIPERGYRPGWDADHQWDGLIPFEDMPGVIDPERGWIGTANNRLATGDYPYPLASTASSGYRARRIRQLIEGSPNGDFTREHFRGMQMDTVSLRALDCVPLLLNVLDEAPDGDEAGAAAREILRQWDGHVETSSAGPAVFNVFFKYWADTVVAERFAPEARSLLSAGADGLAARLLKDDPHQWFAQGDRREKIRAAFRRAVEELQKRFGNSARDWTWDKLHLLPLNHVLVTRGEVGRLLGYGGMGVRGDLQSLCNTGSGPEWIATTGGGFRMVADLAQAPGLWTVDGQSQSGQPGSPHYQDQLDDWLAGQLHSLPLDREQAAATIRYRLCLQPR